MKFPVIPVSSGLIIQNNKVLIGLRSKSDNGGGLWEFPGGKVELGEDPIDALHRELKEELNIEISHPQVYAVGHHCYPEKEVILMVYECWHIHDLYAPIFLPCPPDQLPRAMLMPPSLFRASLHAVRYLWHVRCCRCYQEQASPYGTRR